MAASEDGSADAGRRLRDRIYQRVVPRLALALLHAQGLGVPTPDDLSRSYRMAITVLFRLLFVAYAEDKKLLPYESNDAYTRQSLKETARAVKSFVEDAGGSPAWATDSHHWRAAVALFEAVTHGNPSWGVPRYGGALFEPEPTDPAARALEQVELPDTEFGPVLSALLLDETPAGLALLDFQTLGVRMLGTIYEGLLESRLAVAQTDLAIDSASSCYRPAQPGEPIVCRAGEAFLCNRSGERRSTGSYYTPAFAVEHLLDGALRPALSEHLARLEELDQAEAAEQFFHFHVADIAMGSGHFLVAAIDVIAHELAGALARRPLPGVDAQLARIEDEARERLSHPAGRVSIDPVTLVRRQVARRCVYGVDLNPVAVDLARLSMWIHTFVPGLPLSDFDHNLRQGNSLLGVSAPALEDSPGCEPFSFPVAFPEVFGSDDGGFDVILGNPPWEEATLEEDRFWLRHHPGFAGLPQREQEQVKQRLRSERPDLVQQLEQERESLDRLRRLLVSGAYPGMEKGDPDLYKAFCWQFWRLTRSKGGRVGVVLPRSALSASGSRPFRLALFEGATVEDLCTLTNRGGWVFEGVHPQYTIALLCFVRGPSGPPVLRFRGPFSSREAYANRRQQAPAVFPASQVPTWSDAATVPLLPTEGSARIFERLRRHPRLDLDDGKSWRARPYTDLHATHDKKFMTFRASQPPGYWPVFKGGTFDHWTCDRGPSQYYAWIDPDTVVPELQRRRQVSRRRRNSPVYEMPADWPEDPKTLPCRSPRLVFRDVSRATDTRTVRAAVIPGEVIVQNTAPYFLWPRGSAKDMAFLLGVLCSRCLDWYARRFVELHLNYHILNSLPVPRPRAGAAHRKVVELAGRLAAHDPRLAEWAGQVGVPCGVLAEDTRQQVRAELEAVVAVLYGLDEDDLVHVYETFHEGWDPSAELAAVLPHFRHWAEAS